jgi:electron transfer flavoprotein beta subunit
VSPPVAVLLRRLQARPGAPDDDDVLGRCEGGALATAFELAQRLEAPVHAIAVGPARREDRVLAMALRAGCARAMRVDDSELAEVDYLGLAQVLAAAIRHVGARVVVCGDRSADEGAGAIGPAVAELLGWSHLTCVTRIAIEADSLVAVRRADGVMQRVRLQMPAVVCAVAPPLERPARASTNDPAPDDAQAEDEPVDPRSKRKPRPRTPPPSIDELELSELGLDPRAVAPRRTSAGRLRQVRSRGAAALASSAADLIERLRADRLLGES